MPLIGLAGETFRRHAGVFGTRRGLQDVKKVEADRLLDLYGAALRAVFSDILDPDIAAPPEIIDILLLRREQLLESLIDYAIHGPLGTTAELLGRSRRRGVIDHVLGELDGAATASLDRERDLPEVLAMHDLVSIGAGRFQCTLGATDQEQAALFGPMAEHDAAGIGVAGARMQHTSRKVSGLSRIVAVGAGTLSIRHHLGGDDDRRVGIEERHAI